MTRVVVTGAEGFIGRPLTIALKDAGHQVIEVSRSVGDISVTDTWSGLADADIVVHLAAKITGRNAWDNPGDFIRVNVGGTVEALRYCQLRGARLVYVSSYLYGNPETLPVSESATVVATNPYSLSKKLAEEACQFFSEKVSVDVTILRPFNVYGPEQREDFLIPTLIAQSARGQTVTVGDATARRDYVYISDLVDAILLAVNHPRRFEILNIGTGTSHSVADMVAIIEEIRGKKLTISVTGESSPIIDCQADITAA